MLVGAALPPRLAGQESISSDRPGIGSGATVVSGGIWQVEGGLERAAVAGGTVTSVGQLLLRFGVAGIELQLLPNSFVVQRNDDVPGFDTEGFVDGALGLKVPVARSSSVNVSVQGLLTTPSGTAELSGNEWVPAANLLADVSVVRGLPVGVNVGFEAGRGGAEDVVSLIVTPGFSLSERAGIYGGVAAFFTDSVNSYIAEGGATYLVSDDLQLDVNGGYDVDSEDWFLGVGAAFRVLGGPPR